MPRVSGSGTWVAGRAIPRLREAPGGGEGLLWGRQAGRGLGLRQVRHEPPRGPPDEAVRNPGSAPCWVGALETDREAGLSEVDGVLWGDAPQGSEVGKCGREQAAACPMLTLEPKGCSALSQSGTKGPGLCTPSQPITGRGCLWEGRLGG